MAFMIHPGNVMSYCPGYPTTYEGTPLMLGYRADEDLYVFNMNGKFFIAEQWMPSWRINSALYKPVGEDDGSTGVFNRASYVNGYPYWENNNNSYIYFSVKEQCFIRTSRFAGYEPTYSYTTGDYFEKVNYPFSYFHTNDSSDTDTITLTPAGNVPSGTQPITGEKVHPRWQKESDQDTPYGKYIPVGGASGTRFLGSPMWKDNLNNSYIRPAGNAGWGGISGMDGSIKRGWNSNHEQFYFIGSFGDIAGWWESNSEPSKTEPVVFRFTVPEGSTVTGADRTLTFNKYVQGENYIDDVCYVTEVPVWS